MATRYKGNAASIDLDSREITPFRESARPARSTTTCTGERRAQHPSLAAGCTCNYVPVSLACVPKGNVERGGAE